MGTDDIQYSDKGQLDAQRRFMQPFADVTKLEGQLLAEKIRHEQTFQTAVNALHEIAEMDVDAHSSLGDIIRRMKHVASEAFIAIVEPEPTSAPVECVDEKEMPPFLVKARRDRMREIWFEVNGQ